MICPRCGHNKTKVYDSRLTNGDRSVRRRRECLDCLYRFTTLEEVKVLDLYVEKRSGQVVPFDEDRLTKGIVKSFNKRKLDNQKIAKIVQSTIEDILETGKNPIRSTRIGKIVLKNLKNVDEAAYICYWAMYGNFDTSEAFKKIITEIQEKDKNLD